MVKVKAWFGGLARSGLAQSMSGSNEVLTGRGLYNTVSDHVRPLR